MPKKGKNRDRQFRWLAFSKHVQNPQGTLGLSDMFESLCYFRPVGLVLNAFLILIFHPIQSQEYFFRQFRQSNGQIMLLEEPPQY